MDEIAFFAGAIGAIGGAIAVVTLRNPFYSVLALVVHLVFLAGIFLLLRAQFLAAAQIVVYAGAVMVIYVFVAAYVGGIEEPMTAIEISTNRATARIGPIILRAGEESNIGSSIPPT